MEFSNSSKTLPEKDLNLSGLLLNTDIQSPATPKKTGREESFITTVTSTDDDTKSIGTVDTNEDDKSSIEPVSANSTLSKKDKDKKSGRTWTLFGGNTSRSSTIRKPIGQSNQELHIINENQKMNAEIYDSK